MKTNYANPNSFRTLTTDPLGLYFSEEALRNKDFVAAIKYLEQHSPTAAKIIQDARMDARRMDLDISKDIYGNKYTHTPAGFFDMMFRNKMNTGGTVHWNPRVAFSLSNCAPGEPDIIPPALILLHEMVHFNQSANWGYFSHITNDKTNDEKRWSSGSEKNAIEQEQSVARELGVGVRQSHSRDYKEKPYYEIYTDKIH